MKLPLPLETREYFGDNQHRILKMSNLGLLFNKYVYSWQNNWQMEEKNSKEFRDAVCKITFAKDHIVNLLKRQHSMLSSLQSYGWHIEAFTATTDSRLIIGLGGTSVIETGLTLHPLYGFPYLPGSGLKGLARAYVIAEDFTDEDNKKRLLRETFGSEDKDPYNVANNRQGKVFFLDGLPTEFPKLELDIMNPHYGEYYRGEKPPADYLNPVPVTFLAVAAGQQFAFAVYSRDKILVEKAKAWLIGGLKELGAGGKTNVGYGYFKDFTNTNIVIQTQPDKSEKQNLQNRVRSIKNPQTFAEFLQGIKEDEMESLKEISFKGMESVINIGLLGALESAEIPNEIRKVLAQKMLEVCKEPSKKYFEKVDKYKKLQAIAGIVL